MLNWKKSKNAQNLLDSKNLRIKTENKENSTLGRLFYSFTHSLTKSLEKQWKSPVFNGTHKQIMEIFVKIFTPMYPEKKNRKSDRVPSHDLTKFAKFHIELRLKLLIE